MKVSYERILNKNTPRKETVEIATVKSLIPFVINLQGHDYSKDDGFTFYCASKDEIGQVSSIFTEETSGPGKHAHEITFSPDSLILKAGQSHLNLNEGDLVAVIDRGMSFIVLCRLLKI